MRSAMLANATFPFVFAYKNVPAHYDHSIMSREPATDAPLAATVVQWLLLMVAGWLVARFSGSDRPFRCAAGVVFVFGVVAAIAIKALGFDFGYWRT